MIFGSWQGAFRKKNARNRGETVKSGDRRRRRVTFSGCGLAVGLLGSAAILQFPFWDTPLAVRAAEATKDEAQLLLNAAGEPHLAQRLPENTPVAVFSSIQDESFASLRQFELFDKIAGQSGSLTSPLGLPFLPLDADSISSARAWSGRQAAIALLPETAPRRVSPVDLDSKMYGITQIVDADEFAEFVGIVESTREQAPEQTVYEGATLWVWPTRTETFNYSDYESPEVLEPIEVEPEAPESKALGQKLIAKQIAFDDETLAPPSGGYEDDPYYNEPGYDDPYDEDGYTVEIPGLTIAQVGNYAILAQEAQTVKEAIAYQLRLSDNLAQNELFLRSQYAQTENALFHVYANVSETSKFDLSSEFPGFGQFPIPPGLPSLPNLPVDRLFSAEARLLASQMTQGMTIEGIIYSQPEGLRLQGRVYGNEILRPVATPDLPYADSAIQFIPAPAYSLASGRDFAGFWQRVASFLSLDETAKGFLEQARSLAFTFTGLDLDTELIGWMDREIAFFSFPSNQGLINTVFPGAGIELGLAIQTSDRATAEATLDALDTLAQDFLATDIAIDTLVNDSPAVNWRIPAEGNDPEFSFLGQSWVSEDTVMFTSGIGAMNRLLNATAFEPLDEHPTFLNATRSLADPNNGYSYVNAGSSLSLIYGFVEDWFELDPNDPFFVTAKSYLGTFRSFSGTTSSTEDYWQLDSLVVLAPAERDFAENEDSQAKLKE